MKKHLIITFVLLVISHSLFSQDSRIWATYYGGTANEGGFSVATDGMGNVFMAGITMSNTGIASGGFQNSFGGGNVDAYLVKFDSAGARLWATYYGGAGNEMAFFGGKMGIAADAAGNVYMAGLTGSTSGIASPGGFQTTIGGAVNAYLVKFDAAGNRLWATYYGDSGPDKGYSVATDKWGNVYLAGPAGSTSGIAFNGFQNTSAGLGDAFLVKFDSAGNRIWATYYGGPGTDEGFSVATDVTGNVYLAGYTSSASGIASGGFQNNFGGGANDIFLVKFDSSGARLWATYYGGAGDELALFAGDISVTTDALSNVLIAGLTTSTASIASGGFQNTHGGGDNDAFLVKFNSSGARLWGTYYGGTGSDRGYNVTTDAAGNIFLVGRTESSGAISANGFQNSYGGGQDMFLAKFNSSGVRLCATYFGAADVDECNGVAVDHSGNVYVAGNTANTSGIAWNGFQNFHGGGTSDAALVKFTSTCGTSAIDEYENKKIYAYPNPANDNVIIESAVPTLKITVRNQFGNIIYQNAKPALIHKINVSAFANGIYFLNLETADEVFQKKIEVIR